MQNINLSLAYLLVCVFHVDTQCEGSSPRERNAGEAYAEKALCGREKEAVQGVGHCIGFKAQKDAASEPFMEQHRYEPRNGECYYSCKVSEVLRAG